ncbi:hypothetical protein NMG60_11001659 [Bertholletia excelsa]
MEMTYLKVRKGSLICKLNELASILSKWEPMMADSVTRQAHGKRNMRFSMHANRWLLCLKN